MTPIAMHFDMMLEPEEQTRIGATKSTREEMRVMRLLAAYREKCEMLVMQCQLVTALELEIAPFRSKRGIGGYIDDTRNERNAAQAKLSLLSIEFVPRIQLALGHGGMFNPDLNAAYQVTVLLRDIREALTAKEDAK